MIDTDTAERMRRIEVTLAPAEVGSAYDQLSKWAWQLGRFVDDRTILVEADGPLCAIVWCAYQTDMHRIDESERPCAFKSDGQFGLLIRSLPTPRVLQSVMDKAYVLQHTATIKQRMEEASAERLAAHRAKQEESYKHLSACLDEYYKVFPRPKADLTASTHPQPGSEATKDNR